jgi:Zn-dependent protease with chaperone function
MEVSMRIIEGRSIRKMERAGIDAFGGMGPSKLPMVFFLVSLLFLLSLSIDLVYMDRSLELFFSATSLGSTLGVVLLVLGMCVCLPLFFKWMMPISSRLPPGVAADIRETASTLGFSPRAVLSMDTGHRVANAAMVGALPWPRFLVLTDGIMSLLDLQALKGVVAHEVGHARAGHPGLILLIVGGLCLLLINPMLIADFESAGILTQATLGGILFGAGFFGFRAVAHRFEFEADKMAADALGGAEPCISALSRVASVHQQHGDRNSFRHPSYSRRIRRLLAWERDGGYRQRFDDRGKWLRRGIALFILVCLSISVWSQVRNWPIDRAVMLHYRGEFAAAHEQIQRIDPDHRAVDQESLRRLDEESLAAIELVGPSADWNEVREELSAKAWARGITELASNGPIAARPWFALALSKEHNSPLERSVYRYCAAAADADLTLMERLEDHLFSLGVPREIGDAIR